MSGERGLVRVTADSGCALSFPVEDLERIEPGEGGGCRLWVQGYQQPFQLRNAKAVVRRRIDRALAERRER